MALSIKDLETERLARDLAQRTGETITDATKKALEERLQRVGIAPRKQRLLLEDLVAIRERCARLPVLDDRSPQDVLGYDENGLPR
ncbi:MAG: type II toxin-antitoxin system VapB family antitoxin [Rhodospirillaceae bacterium]